MKKIILILCLCMPLAVAAQQLSTKGYNADELVPAGWAHTESTGDLNKDGIPDMAIIALPNYPEGLKKRDDEFTYNFNRPVLAIYFGDEKGQLHKWKEYKELLPAMENEYETIEREVKITPRNTLIINLSFFYSAGGYSNVSNSYTFRMQQGDFYLIGEDVCELSRLTGDMRTESFNYLTHKKQTLAENAFDEKVKAKETWQNIAKEPLKRLGETELQ